MLTTHPMVKSVIRELSIFKAALSFFTALPMAALGGGGESSPQVLGAAVKYFALVGLVVALGMSACYHFCRLLWSHDISCCLTMISGFFLTRCLHEDGLADCADGFGGGWTKEQVLELMKDPRHGTFGVVGLASLFSLKFLALSESGTQTMGLSMTLVLVFSQVLSRMLAWGLTLVMTDARSSGPLVSKSQAVLSGPKQEGVWVNGIILVIFSGVDFKAFSASMLVGIPVFCLVTFYLKRRMGGYTGDCLGASQQIFEVLILLTFLVLKNSPKVTL